MSYTYEMRDTGDVGFLVPAEQIVPNAEEIVASLVQMIIEGQALGYFKFTPNVKNNL